MAPEQKLLYAWRYSECDTLPVLLCTLDLVYNTSFLINEFDIRSLPTVIQCVIFVDQVYTSLLLCMHAMPPQQTE